MVSKLDILIRYYQIQLDNLENNYFEYNGSCYYLATSPIYNGIEELYQQYINELNLDGFTIVMNCFNQIFSEGCVLYTYHRQPIDVIQYVINTPKVSTNNIKLLDVKQRWCMKIDDARLEIGKYASRVSLNEYYIVLSYYYQGMAECAIQVMNFILNDNQDSKIPSTIAHVNCNLSYDFLINPHNLIISSRIRDILLLYKGGYVSLDVLKSFIQTNSLTKIELQYLYARSLFPSEFFSYILSNDTNEIDFKSHLRWCYNHLKYEKELIIALYELILDYTWLPCINWLYSV